MDCRIYDRTKSVILSYPPHSARMSQPCGTGSKVVGVIGISGSVSSVFGNILRCKRYVRYILMNVQSSAYYIQERVYGVKCI